jgi:hypothetical protein
LEEQDAEKSSRSEQIINHLAIIVTTYPPLQAEQNIGQLLLLMMEKMRLGAMFLLRNSVYDSTGEKG